MSIQVRSPPGAGGSPNSQDRWYWAYGRTVRPVRMVAALSLAASLALASVAPAAAVMAGQVMPTAPAGVAATTGKLGARPGASRLPIPISDAVDASVDVGTGNVMITVAGLPIPGVGVEKSDVALACGANAIPGGASSGAGAFLKSIT